MTSFLGKEGRGRPPHPASLENLARAMPGCVASRCRGNWHLTMLRQASAESQHMNRADRPTSARHGQRAAMCSPGTSSRALDQDRSLPQRWAQGRRVAAPWLMAEPAPSTNPCLAQLGVGGAGDRILLGCRVWSILALGLCQGEERSGAAPNL